MTKKGVVTTHKRTIVKAGIYRLCMTFVYYFAFAIATTYINSPVCLSLLIAVVGTVFYYGYDRLWSYIGWGIVHKKRQRR
jgi:uncharacterized membrane protein